MCATFVSTLKTDFIKQLLASLLELGLELELWLGWGGVLDTLYLFS